VREPRDALEVGVDHEGGDGNRPQPAHDRVELVDREEKDTHGGQEEETDLP